MKEREIIADTTSRVFFNSEHKIAIECSEIGYTINERFMRVSGSNIAYKSRFIEKHL